MFHKILPKGVRLAVRLAIPLAVLLAILLAVMLPASLFAASGQGRVLDARERPVAGAAVFLLPAEGPPLRAATDREGVFRVPDLPGGTYDLAVRADGYAPLAVRGIPVPAAAPASTVDLGTVLLQPGAELAGRVAGEDGEPVAGATVRVLSGDPVAARLAELGEAPEATTGADGEFTVRGLRPGDSVAVRVEHPDYAGGGGAAGVPVPAGDPLTVEVLRGPPARPEARRAPAATATLEGRVLGPDRRPVAGARVRVMAAEERGDPLAVLAAAVSDADGRFRLTGVPRGTVRVEAGKDGLAATSREVRLPGPVVRGLELRLGAGEEKLAGRILGLSFEELSRVEVRASGPGAETRTAAVDYTGAWRLERLAAGEWTVTARVGEREAKGRVELGSRASVASGAGGETATLDLTFPGNLVLSGTVQQGGDPVTEARIEVRRPGGGPAATTATDADGRFRVEGLEPGPYEVLVLLPGRTTPFRRSVELPAGSELVLDVPRRISLLKD